MLTFAQEPVKWAPVGFGRNRSHQLLAVHNEVEPVSSRLRGNPPVE